MGNSASVKKTPVALATSSSNLAVDLTRKIKIFVTYSWDFRAEDVRKMARFLKQQPDFHVSVDLQVKDTLTFEAAMEIIIKADVVLVFFCEHFSKPGSRSLIELSFARNKRKEIIPIRIQKGYEPRGELSFMLEDRLWLDYLEDTNFTYAASLICNKIRSLELSSGVDDFVQKFHPVNVPFFASRCYSRPLDEQKLLKEFLHTFRFPEQGILVVAGEGGVGKTTTISRLFTNENRFKRTAIGEDIISLANVAVFWLNCYGWRDADAFDDQTKQTFCDELVSSAKQCSPGFDSVDPSYIATYFLDKNIHVLFVFDDFFNPNLVKFFLELHKNKTPPSCCVITRDPDLLAGENFVRKTLKMEALPDDEMKKMLGIFYGMNVKFPDDKLTNLAAICHGLPLIASLTWARFKFADDWDEVYGALMASSQSNASQLQLLFGFSIDQLKSDLRSCYYSFLFFDPAEPVSLGDLQIFWRVQATTGMTAISTFQKKSLIKLADSGAEDRFIVVPMLFEAALERAVTDYKLSSTNQADQLQEFREKLILDEIVTTTVADREMVLFEAVRQGRRHLIEQTVKKLAGSRLVPICRQQMTKKQDDTQAQSFLQFLYHVPWPDDIQYPEGHPNEKWGCKHSYRLIREILMKMKQNGLDKEMGEVATVGSGTTCLLTTLFDEEDKQPHYYERKPLVSLLTRWKTLYDESEWIRQELNGAKIVSAAITGDLTLIKEIYQESGNNKRPTSDSRVSEALLAATRRNHKEIVDFFYKQDKDCFKASDFVGGSPLWYVAQNGHLYMMKFIYENGGESLVSAADEEGWTPLMAAAENGHSNVLSYIYNKEPAEIKSQNSDEETPLWLAAKNGHLEVVKFLFDKKSSMISIKNAKGASPLWIASQNGHLEVVKFLHEKHPSSVSEPNRNSLTPLMVASYNGHFDVVKFLCQNGAKKSGGKKVPETTPLFIASANGFLDVVKFLCEWDHESVSMLDKDKWTPIMIAAQNGHLEVVKYLLGKDSTIASLANESGLTPAMIAMANGHSETAKILNEHLKSFLEI